MEREVYNLLGFFSYTYSNIASLSVMFLVPVIEIKR